AMNPGPDAGSPQIVDLECPTLAMPAAPGTVFVDKSGAGPEEGTQTAPDRSLARAFERAGEGGVIWVAEGVYAENLIVPPKNLAVVGGFAPGFASRSDACATILEPGDPAQPILSASYDVASFGLDGVTL